MARSKRRLNRTRILLTLAAVSVVAVLLPRSVTGRLISLVQVIIPFQDWTTRTLDAGVSALDGADSAPVPRSDYDAVETENQALVHQLTATANQLYALRKEYEQVAGIRSRGLNRGRLIAARVVSEDASPLRRSHLINSGRLSGIRPGAAVTSNHFTIDTRDDEGLRGGLSVLAGEVLVGFVDQVGTRSARVRMLTDPQTQMKVVMARLEDGKYSPLEAEFWLVGTGASKLEVRDVDHRYIKSGSIKVGDSVLTVSADTRLPASFNIGAVSKIRPDPDNSLIYILEVTPPLDLADVRKVFVVDPYGEG